MLGRIARAGVRGAVQRARMGPGARQAAPAAAALFQLQQRRAMSVNGIPEADQKWSGTAAHRRGARVRHAGARRRWASASGGAG